MGFRSARMDFDFTFEQSGDNDFGGPTFSPKFSKTLRFGAGLTDASADLAFIDYRTIAASANDDLDIAGGIVDAFGVTITMAEVVGIIVAADDANTNDLLIGGGSNPLAALWGAAGDIIKVKPGGLFVNMATKAAGLSAVVASTGDILRIANGGSGTPVSYSIALLGRSA